MSEEEQHPAWDQAPGRVNHLSLEPLGRRALLILAAQLAAGGEAISILGDPNEAEQALLGPAKVRVADPRSGDDLPLLLDLRPPAVAVVELERSRDTLAPDGVLLLRVEDPATVRESLDPHFERVLTLAAAPAIALVVGDLDLAAATEGGNGAEPAARSLWSVVLAGPASCPTPDPLLLLDRSTPTMALLQEAISWELRARAAESGAAASLRDAQLARLALSRTRIRLAQTENSPGRRLGRALRRRRGMSGGSEQP